MKHLFYFLFLFVFESCAQQTVQENPITNNISTPVHDSTSQTIEEHITINPSGSTLETRMLPPQEFERITKEENSYAEYLRYLPLKPHGSEVKLFNGGTKPNRNIYDAVIELEIGNKDLHQCADAVMRLRAEYLWTHERYEDIHFNFTNGFRVDYSEWMEGNRMVVNGNKTYWEARSSPSNTYQDFWDYMELIFTYAGTLSLSKELVQVDFKDINIGDVLIWGGSPGHAVLVIDMAENSRTNEKVFLLAQSYMPAQEIQILRNPDNSELSPWYAVSEIENEIHTPEWTFKTEDLKRFNE